jgi:glucosamine-6-phosphate deaminase
LLLGKNFFYENGNALIRATHGLLYIKKMNVKEFTGIARSLKKLSEGTEV